jgi:hypothetical protein
MARNPTRGMIQAQVDVQMPDTIDLAVFQGWFDGEAEDIADYILNDAKSSTSFQDISGQSRKKLSKKKVRDGNDNYWIVQWNWPTAHLLEFGHLLVRDGKVIGHVPAKPVMVPAKEKGIAEALRRFGAR